MKQRPRDIVILTGAGISAESGISTFRDEGGLWAQHRIEDVATPEAFARNPDLVQQFYSARRAQLEKVEPNMAHFALGRLERDFKGRVLIVTQNVDNLHERGGSQAIVHMHGELQKVRCLHCNTVHTWVTDCNQNTPCPACNKAPGLRPHIVWFGEMPFQMEMIADRLTECDLFISIGTSGNVYPAAGFVQEVRMQSQAHTVEINLEPSEGVSYFEEHRHGPAGKEVPQFVDEILALQD